MTTNGTSDEVANQQRGETPLPPRLAKAYEASIAAHYEVAAHRDRLVEEVGRLKQTIAQYKVAFEAQEQRITDLESRAMTAQMVRDDAVGDRAKYETLFISV